MCVTQSSEVNLHVTLFLTYGLKWPHLILLPPRTGQRHLHMCQHISLTNLTTFDCIASQGITAYICANILQAAAKHGTIHIPKATVQPLIHCQEPISLDTQSYVEIMQHHRDCIDHNSIQHSTQTQTQTQHEQGGSGVTDFYDTRWTSHESSSPFPFAPTHTALSRSGNINAATPRSRSSSPLQGASRYSSSDINQGAADTGDTSSGSTGTGTRLRHAGANGMLSMDGELLSPTGHRGRALLRRAMNHPSEYLAAGSRASFTIPSPPSPRAATSGSALSTSHVAAAGVGSGGDGGNEGHSGRRGQSHSADVLSGRCSYSQNTTSSNSQIGPNTAMLVNSRAIISAPLVSEGVYGGQLSTIRDDVDSTRGDFDIDRSSTLLSVSRGIPGFDLQALRPIEASAVGEVSLVDAGYVDCLCSKKVCRICM